MKVRQNLHLHSYHSCDNGCATLSDIAKNMDGLGVTDYGVSDHLYSRYNLVDIESCRNDIIGCQLRDKLHLGVEASVMTKWECEKIDRGDYERKGNDPIYGLRSATLPDGKPEYCLGMNEPDKKRLGIEYVIGASHWSLTSAKERDQKFQEIYDQHLWMMENPLIDIIGHPWRALQYAVNSTVSEPEAIMEVPDTWNVTLGELALKHNKCLELNFEQLISRSLPEKVLRWNWKWMAQWREMGVKFTIGSNSHAPHPCSVCYGAMGLLLDHYGFADDDIHYFFAQK